MTNTTFDNDQVSAFNFTVGAVIGRAFDVFRKGSWRFLMLALIVSIPNLLIPYLTRSLLGGSTKVPAVPSSSVFLNSVVTMIVAITCVLVVEVMIFYGAFQIMRGRPFTLGESLQAGVKRLIPAWVTMIVVTVIYGFGMVLLVVPGLILMCVTYVAVPACVIESPGIFASIGRSRELTKGFRWQIFGILMLVGVVMVAVSIFGRYLFGGSLMDTTLTMSIPVVAFNYLWGALTTTFTATLAVVVYHDLRVVKEGVDADRIANVFD
jgi:hypothetical protein